MLLVSATRLRRKNFSVFFDLCESKLKLQRYKKANLVKTMLYTFITMHAIRYPAIFANYPVIIIKKLIQMFHCHSVNIFN